MTTALEGGRQQDRPIPITRFPFTNERFAYFICFGGGDKHGHNFFL